MTKALKRDLLYRTHLDDLRREVARFFAFSERKEFSRCACTATVVRVAGTWNCIAPLSRHLPTSITTQKTNA